MSIDRTKTHGLLTFPKQVAIAEKYKKSPAQVLLSWNIQRGVSVIPKSVTPSRIVDNFQDIVLDEADFQAIDKLSIGNEKRLVEPANFWKVEIFSSEEVKYL